MHNVMKPVVYPDHFVLVLYNVVELVARKGVTRQQGIFNPNYNPFAAQGAVRACSGARSQMAPSTN
jgi:hypothetical protein